MIGNEPLCSLVCSHVLYIKQLSFPTQALNYQTCKSKWMATRSVYAIYYISWFMELHDLDSWPLTFRVD